MYVANPFNEQTERLKAALQGTLSVQISLFHVSYKRGVSLQNLIAFWVRLTSLPHRLRDLKAKGWQWVIDLLPAVAEEIV